MIFSLFASQGRAAGKSVPRQCLVYSKSPIQREVRLVALRSAASQVLPGVHCPVRADCPILTDAVVAKPAKSAPPAFPVNFPRRRFDAKG
jgi:hypothetical protein